MKTIKLYNKDDEIEEFIRKEDVLGLIDEMDWIYLCHGDEEQAEQIKAELKAKIDGKQ